MQILLTNDDGIFASGLRALYKALTAKGHTVHTFSPLIEKSGASNSISLRTPVSSQEIRDNAFLGTAINGTPVDCVKIGTKILQETHIDLVVSGINAGSNIGTDILYSGTVAAAAEGCITGLPAIAFSRIRKDSEHTEAYAAHAANFVSNFDFSLLPKNQFLNLNYPSGAISEAKGIKVCSMSMQPWEEHFDKHYSSDGTPYWWVSGYIPYEKALPGTDVDFLAQGWITLTPLQLNMSAEETFKTIEAGINRL